VRPFSLHLPSSGKRKHTVSLTRSPPLSEEGGETVLCEELRHVFLCLILLQLHLLRRVYESVAVTVSSPSSKMHLLIYLFGLLHYILVPFVFVAYYYTDHVVAHMEYLSVPHLPQALLGLVQLTLGDTWTGVVKGREGGVILPVVLWMAGNGYQYWCHYLLAATRSSPSNGPGGVINPYRGKGDASRDGSNTAATLVHISPTGSKYVLLSSHGFQWVTCPHYSAEIAIYLSFSLLCPHKVTPLLLLGWVVINLSTLAGKTYEWNIKTFGSTGYWKIIPFVY
jgi:3-oxo-5-alpha-steroid 4-dehydrogenase 3